MKALAALQADRKELQKKFTKLVLAKDAIAEEVAKIDHAIATLSGQVDVGVGAKPVAPKPIVAKKNIKNPKNASNQKRRHAAIRAILKRPGNEKLTYQQADAIRIKEAKSGN